MDYLKIIAPWAFGKAKFQATRPQGRFFVRQGESFQTVQAVQTVQTVQD